MILFTDFAAMMGIFFAYTKKLLELLFFLCNILTYSEKIIADVQIKCCEGLFFAATSGSTRNNNSS